MGCDFILIPDIQVFETAFLAKEQGDSNHISLKMFKASWTYYIDSRERIIVVTENLDGELIEKHYKSEKTKRNALFSILSVHPEKFDCCTMMSLLRLASILSIQIDKKVFYVTDNPEIRDLINKEKALLFEAISSEKALELVEQVNKKFIESLPKPEKLLGE